MKHNTTSSRPAGRRSAATTRGFALRPLAFAALMLTQGVHALPTGGQVVNGQVQINQPTTNTMVLDQGTNKAVINWQGFGVGAQEKLTINQPNAQSVLLNRVVGMDPSYILGQMQANGRVFLLNPNGIVFGQNARVDVGSLVATTMHLSDTDFLAGRYMLTDLGGGQGDLAGRVINNGTINAPHGSVVLAGHEVINSGQILAEGGRVGLIAASKVLVDVEGDGLLFFQVEGKEAGARLEQLGRIEANGGSVELMAASRGQMADTVLNMSGVVQARTLGMKGGRVVIDGGDTGITAVSGTIDVTGAEAGQKGGDAVVQGQRVLIDSTAVIDASGSAGGGRARIGGGFQGADASVRNADMTTVRQGARVKANALVAGNGGQVAIWSNTATRFFGNVEARGAGALGQGGFVEVSGHQYLDYSGLVDVTAQSGLTGTLLLDPTELTIVATGDSHVTGSGADSNPFSSNGSNSTLGWDTIKLSLSTANTKVQTSSHDLVIQDASGDLASNKNLTLLSAANVVQATGADITNTGSGSVTLQSASNANVFLNGNITTGGSVTIAGPSSLVGNSTLTTTGTTSKIDMQGLVTGNAHDLTLSNTGNTGAADAVKIAANSSGASVTGVSVLKIDGKSTLNGDVNTFADQTYTGAVKLGNGLELKTTGITAKIDLQGGVDGNAKNLTLTNTANAAGVDAIKTGGAIGSVAVLTVTGKSTLGGNVTTTGKQIYTDGVTLSANAQLDAGSAKIALTGVDGGTKDLALKSTNTGADAIKTTGTISNVGALTVTGKSTLGGNVASTGNQGYTDTVTLTGNTQFDAGSAKIALASVDGGTKDLTLKSTSTDADAIKTSGAIGNVAALNVTGKSTLGGNVTSTGNQSYTDTVTLSVNAQLDAGASKIALAGVDGGTKNLTLKSTNAAADAIKTTGLIGNVATLNVTGKSTLGGNVMTTGNQTYTDAVTLSANAQLDAGSAKIALTSVDGGTKDLALKSTNTGVDAIKTSGAIGNVAALSVTGKSTLGGNVTSTGNQSYTDTVTLSANAQLDAGASKIALKTVDGGAKDLTLKSTSIDADAIKTSGAIGNVAALNVTGKSTLGGNVTSTGNQTYADTVTLSANAQLDAGASKIALKTVDGGAKDLTLKSTNAAADAIKTAGAIGNVAALTVTGKSTLGGNVTSTGNQSFSDTTTLTGNTQLDAGSAKIILADVDGGTKDLTLKSASTDADAIKTTGTISNVGALLADGKTTVGGDVTTAGNQTYTKAVTVGGNAVTLKTTGATSKLALQGEVDGNGKTLALTNTDNTTDADAIATGGAITNVAALTVTGRVALGGDVTAINQQTYNNTVTLAGSDTTRVLTAGTDVELNGMVGAGKNLTIAASSNAVMNGAVNGVATLDTTASGTTQINTDISAATQRYGASTLGGSGATRTLSGTDVTLAAVDGGGKSLTVGAANRATLGGVVSNVQDLAVTGTNGVAVGADVTTAGAQVYNGNVTLTGPVRFRAPSLTFNNSLDASVFNLGLLTKSWVVGGALGTNGSLTSLGGNIQISDNEAGHDFTVATGLSDVVTADQFAKFATAGFGGVTIGASDAGSITVGVLSTSIVLPTNLTLISGSTVNVNATVSGAHGLAIQSTGPAALVAPISVASLSVDSGSLIKVGGDVTTTGNQTYTKTVQLGTSAVQLQSTGTTSKIDLQGGVDGNGQGLTLATANTTAADAIKTGGAISNVATLNVAGKSTLGGDVSTTGNQSYGDAVTLSKNVQLDAGGARIALTSVDAGAKDLTLKSTNAAADAIRTTGAIGNVATLNVAGKSTLGGNVTSTGNQSYADAVTLTGTTQFDAGNAKIALASLNGGAGNLTLKSTNADADAIKTGGAITNVSALNVAGKSTLGGSVISMGNQTYAGAVTLSANAQLDAGASTISLTSVDGGTKDLALRSTNAAADAIKTSGAISNVAALNVAGNATLGGNVSTSGSQTYSQSVTLGSNVSLSSTAGSITMQQVLGAGHALQVATALGLNLNNIVTGLNSLDVTAGATRFNAQAGLTTAGAQHYAGDVSLPTGADATFAASSLTFDGAVTGSHDLTLNTDHLSAGVLSGTGELRVAPTSAGTTIGLNGATGAISLDLAQTSGFTRYTIGSANAGDVQANAMTLGADTTIQTGGNVTFHDVVNGAHALAVNAAGTTHFIKDVAGDDTAHIAPLTSLTVSGDTVFHGDKLITSGAQTYGGTFRTDVALRKFELDASTVSMLHGVDGLAFSRLHLTSGGTIATTGLLALVGNVNLDGGTLTLESSVAAGSGRTIIDADGIPRTDLLLNNRLLKESALAITQTDGTITTAAGSTLNLRASGGGSISVEHVEGTSQNNIQGNIVAVSGTQGDTDNTRFTSGPSTLVVGAIRIGSNQIHSAGIEADVVKLTAGALDTAPGTKIRARLPYVNAQGTETSLPALTLVPTNPTALNQFGATNPSTWIQVDVGDAAGGYITVRPKGGGSGSSAIFLGGTNGATPFYDGSGKISEIQVYYNGLTPSTPQEVGALSAVTAVIEESRRARFEEVVRTENVSARLRQGVIAEVGSGRPATEGSESIRMPQSCTPTNGLGC